VTLPPPLTAEQVEQERVEFEDEFPDVAIFRELESYSVHAIAKMWESWLSRAALAHLSTKAPDWIACAERLPSLDAGMDMAVWAFTEDGDVYIELWSTENSDEGCFHKYECAKELFDCAAPPGSIPPSRITHWMEVTYPAPPKQAGGAG